MQKKKQSKKTNNTFTLIFLTSLIFIGCAVPQKNVKVGKIDDTGKSKSYEYFYQEGLKELNSKQYERAIELFSKSISLNQSNPKVFLQRGIAYYSKGEYE